jgi:hypothetical protein
MAPSVELLPSKCETLSSSRSTIAGGLRQRLRGHQTFREASLLIKQAVSDSADSSPKSEPQEQKGLSLYTI